VYFVILQSAGVAFVRFKSLKELEAALRRNREQEGVPEMAPSLKEKPRDWELKVRLSLFLLRLLVIL